MKNSHIEYYFKDRYEPRPLKHRIFAIVLAIFLLYCVNGISNYMEDDFENPGDNYSYYSQEQKGDFRGVVILSHIAIIGMALIFALIPIKVSGITEEYDIHSIKDRLENKGKLSGAFFLGCGTISGEQHQQDYYVFYKKGNFGLIKDKIKADETEIIMTDKINPSYKEIIVEGETQQFLFVPKNTIKKTIKIEL